MRITGGKAKGRRLTSPNRHDLSIRPTSDRTREALFNILAEQTRDSIMLDMFAGTGAVGIEALSRGARQVIFVDKSNISIEIIGKNLRSCFKQANARIFKLDLARPADIQWLRKHLTATLHFNLVFMDPPYEKKLACQSLTLLENSGLLASRTRIIVEERHDQRLPELINDMELIDQRSYGETGIWIYQKTEVRGQKNNEK